MMIDGRLVSGETPRRMRGRLRFALALLALVSAVLNPVHADDGIHQVLFVGNSFSFYNNGLHNHYRQLHREAFPDEKARTRLRAFSGARLDEHTGLADVLAAEPWDIVVLQGHSRGPLDGFKRFEQAAVSHAETIRDAGARPVLFQTWAYTDKPEMTDALAQGYGKVGRTIDAEVVPVGFAFAAAGEARPDLALRTSDRKHPTLAGTYLSACVFFAAVTGTSPEGLNYTGGLSADDAEFLQGIAWKTVHRQSR